MAITRSKVIFIIFVLGLIGGFTILYATSRAPWVSSDSVGYIENARSFVAGEGLGFYRATGEFRPLSYHPPLYPLILSIAGFLKIEYLLFARIVNAVLFTATIILSGWAPYTVLDKPALAVSLCLLVLTVPIFIANFSGVMAESLLFALGLAGIMLLLAHLRSGKRIHLNLSALAFGLSIISRYSGASLLIAGVLALILLDGSSLKQRLFKTIQFSFAGIVPIAIWLSIQFFAYPSANPGLFQFEIDNIWNSFTPVRLALVNIIWEWLPVFSWLPLTNYRIRLILLALVVLIFAGLIILAIRKMSALDTQNWIRNNSFRLASIFFIFTLSYIFVVTISYIFVSSPKPALNERILSPILLGIISFSMYIFFFLMDAWPSRRILKTIPAIIVALFILSNTPKAIELVKDLHQNSSGITNPRWQGSGIMQDLLKLPPDIKLISNEIYSILFYAQRPAHTIPELSITEPREIFYKFGDDPNDNVQEIFRNEGAALVLFEEIYWQLYPIYQEQTEERLQALTEGLSLHSERWDGAIYFYDGEN